STLCAIFGSTKKLCPQIWGQCLPSIITLLGTVNYARNRRRHHSTGGGCDRTAASVSLATRRRPLGGGNRCGAHRRACRPLVRDGTGDIPHPEPRLGIPVLARRGQGALGQGLEPLNKQVASRCHAATRILRAPFKWECSKTIARMGR